jgi:hypothetical protein
MARQPPSESLANALWEPCPPGEFARLSRKLRARRQRRTFLQAAALTAITAATGGAAWLALRPDPMPTNPGGISCSEVRRLGDDYQSGKITGCLREQIRTHLTQCPECSARIPSHEACPPNEPPPPTCPP